MARKVLTPSKARMIFMTLLSLSTYFLTWKMKRKILIEPIVKETRMVEARHTHSVQDYQYPTYSAASRSSQNSCLVITSRSQLMSHLNIEFMYMFHM